MSDQKITAYMVDDCLHDPVLGARVLLGYTVPPHMELRLWAMWTKKFFIDSSGFGTAKSLSIAIVAALRCMLMNDRREGIVSRTFGQGQQTHQYFDKWLNNPKSKIFRNEVLKDISGEPVSTHGSIAWTIKFRSGSEIRTIPPDFKAGAERAGSEDWTDGFFDEVTKYPNYLDFFRQLWTRVRKPVPDHYDSTDPIFGRHFYLGGTAKKQWHPFYKRVQAYINKVEAGSMMHEYQSWNYRDVPKIYQDTLMEMDGIRELEEALPEDLIREEVLGEWTKDSLGFYNSLDVKEARSPECPILIAR